MEIISVGHTNSLVKVQLTWVQDPGSSPKSSFEDLRPSHCILVVGKR